MSALEENRCGGYLSVEASREQCLHHSQKVEWARLHLKASGKLHPQISTGLCGQFKDVKEANMVFCCEKYGNHVEILIQPLFLCLLQTVQCV